MSLGQLLPGNIEEAFVHMQGASEEEKARLSRIDASLDFAVEYLDKIINIVDKF